MDYSKFYTPPEIALLLIKELCISPPHSVIDICCGSCNLLRAASMRWKNTQLSGVDITEHASNNVNCIQMDGREFAIQCSQRYPLVVANPPFAYLEGKHEEFSALYHGIFSKYTTKRLENEMLLANLLLLEENGTLLIIMPSTFVEGSRNRAIRKLIGQNYHVKRIIKLPEDTFGTTHINSYAMIVKKTATRSRITKYYSVSGGNSGYVFSKKEVISQKNLRAGEWSAATRQIPREKLDIRRGNISSQFFNKSGIPILHTAKNDTEWRPSIRYTKDDFAMPVYAEFGDIIVSRIGKSAGRWCQHRGERTLISDCLYRIKDPNEIIYNRIRGFEFDFSQKGVATRYITMDDFTAWYHSVEER